jgi:class 3 adenylate cyclase/tetratricopeptide (TPR) repeat protein
MYAQRFAENDIDLDVLSVLTDQDLERLGVSLGHRRKMLRAIAELSGAALANALSKPIRQDAAERRHITVMFCDLAGSTALSTRLDPEDMHAVIDAYHAACARIIAAYEGFIAEFRGDGILAYFGYPLAHEDDAERAVRAGLDIAAAVARLETRAAQPLAVRIGIATGLVVVGDLGSEGALREHVVVGETPNLAARLQALAEPGTIVIAASTRRLLGELFDLRNLGRHELKGIAEPVAVWAVEGASDSESRFEAVRVARLTDLIGREDEIKILMECQRLAWNREGQVVLISGEPGIGKSRIAAAVGERITAEPHTRLRYQCSPHHTNSALHPFIAQLERAAQINPDDPPGQKLDKLETLLALAMPVATSAPLIAALLSIPFGDRYPPLGLSPVQQRRQTFAAILDQLESLAGQKPVLWLFEDAHWADATSRELIDLAVDRIRHLPILAIITYRPEFEPPWLGLPNVRHLALDRLDRSDVENMVTRVTGGRALPAEVMKQIVAKTDGNPLFVEELTKAVLEAGILVEDAEGYRLNGSLPPLAVPATLQESLMARLDRLAPIKEIAQIGAAIGREFSYSLLRELVARDETALKDALAQLEQAELVLRRGEPPEAIYSFKHALVQDAAYESLLKTRRQVLHRRVAEALRDRFRTIADAEPEVVAHHFAQAGLAEAAARWWGKAGERAMDRSAYDEAIAHLEKAIGQAEALADSPDARQLRLWLQTTCAYALFYGRGMALPQTITAFVRARELAAGVEEVAARFSAYFGLWSGSFIRADLTPMREMAETFLTDAQRAPGLMQIGRAHYICGSTCWFQGDYVGARVYLEQALISYDSERELHRASRFLYDVRVIAMARLALVLWSLGDVDRVARLLDSALNLALQGDHIPTIANVRATTCHFVGVRRRAGEARPHAQALLGFAREHGLPPRHADGTFYLGWARSCTGDEDGNEKMREGLARLSEMHYHLFEPITETLFAEREAEVGRVEVGLATLDAQLVAIEQTGQHWFDAEVHRVRGELLLKQQPRDVTTAEAAFRRAIAIARSQRTRTFELRAALSLAKLYQTIGRDQAARELLVPALADFVSSPELPELEEAQRLLTIHAPITAD